MLCAIAALCIGFGQRVVEAISVSFDGEHVTFTAAKGRRGWHVVTRGSWEVS